MKEDTFEYPRSAIDKRNEAVAKLQFQIAIKDQSIEVLEAAIKDVLAKCSNAVEMFDWPKSEVVSVVKDAFEIAYAAKKRVVEIGMVVE